MLKVRLQRVGRKNDPSFRVVVTDSKNGPKSGKFIEVLGSYDARKGEPVLKSDRIKHWLSVGAQASGTVHNLLVKGEIIEGKKVNVLPKHRPIKKAESAQTEAKVDEIQNTPAEEAKSAEASPAEEEIKKEAVEAGDVSPVAEVKVEEGDSAEEKTETPETDQTKEAK